MPHIFDNKKSEPWSALKNALEISQHLGFCLGGFNLRGWEVGGGVAECWAGASKSELTIAEIEAALAQHYRFTPEKLDYILHYDIKYCLSRKSGAQDG
jgi:hypothetical protein